MVQIDPQALGLQFGSGAAIGALIGFFAKKVAKLIAFIIGAQLAVFAFLEQKGILVVRWDKLSAGLLSAPEEVPVDPGWIAPILSTMSVTGGFAGGFYLGFRKG